MESLSHDDILALNRAIGDIYAARDMDMFIRSLFSSIQSLIPCEHCSFNDVDLPPTRILNVITDSQELRQVVSKLLPVGNTHSHEHPLVTPCASGDVVKTTDFASESQLKGMAFYNEYYRHLDTEMQITFSIPVARKNISLRALSRENIDFSERDKLLLTLLRPHLINSLRNVTEIGHICLERDLLQMGAEAERKGVILLRPGGMIVCITALAQEMYGRYFADTLTKGDTLTGLLLQWFETETHLSQPVVNGRDARKAGIAGRFAKDIARKPLVIEKEGKTLVIKLLHDCTTGDSILCVTETAPSWQHLQGYNLSNRETQVLFWISNGKTSVEVGVILGISRRTAEKHLERVFAKLGVETRAAAVAIMRNE